MSHPHRVDLAEARQLYASGLSGAALGRRYGVTKQAVSKWVKRWRREASQQAPGRPRPAPAVAPSPRPSPPSPDALLAALRPLKPGLAAILEAHATLTVYPSAIYVRAKSPWPSQEAMRAAVPHKGFLTALWGRPVGIVW